MGIDATKVVQVVRLYQCYKSISGGVHRNHFISMDTMTKADLHDRLDVMRSYEKKSDIAYKANI